MARSRAKSGEVGVPRGVARPHDEAFPGLYDQWSHEEKKPKAEVQPVYAATPSAPSPPPRLQTPADDKEIACTPSDAPAFVNPLEEYPIDVAGAVKLVIKEHYSKFGGAICKRKKTDMGFDKMMPEMCKHVHVSLQGMRRITIDHFQSAAAGIRQAYMEMKDELANTQQQLAETRRELEAARARIVELDMNGEPLSFQELVQGLNSPADTETSGFTIEDLSRHAMFTSNRSSPIVAPFTSNRSSPIDMSQFSQLGEDVLMPTPVGGSAQE